MRTTLGAGLVVSFAESQLKDLVEALEADFYLDSRTLKEARDAGGEFNAIHKTSGLRIDFFLREAGDYADAAFSRRRRASLLGSEVSLIAPEDLILAKLRWARRGGLR